MNKSFSESENLSLVGGFFSTTLSAWLKEVICFCVGQMIHYLGPDKNFLVIWGKIHLTQVKLWVFL